MTMDHDTAYLQLCINLIEQKLNWRPADEWRNYEFTELSEKILDATGVNLSATTLKRVFGKLKYESLPSSATLNALAVFLGYTSWMALKSKQSLTKQPEPLPDPLISEKSLKKEKLWPVAFLSVGLISILTFSFLSGKTNIPLKNERDIVFTSKPMAEGLPNSVVFNVDLKGNKPNKVVVQQSWDSTRTVTMTPGQKEATGIYYIPGYFRAKLILDGKIVKEHDLFIKSDKWMATIDYKPIPTYIKEKDLLVKEEMSVDDTILNEIKKSTEPIWLTYHLVKPFGNLQSDNFSFESALKNTYADGPAVCKTAKIFILCSNGAFIVPVTLPGCIASVNLKANDNYLDGRSNDLSSFSADLANWTNVKVEVKNRVMKVLLNDKLIREETYKEDAGEIVGLRLSFLGAGAVRNIKLADGNDNIRAQYFSTGKP
jgi:hypothetical protein